MVFNADLNADCLFTGDEFGHDSRGCPKPTDWSRVECTNCHEKGHSYKRCKNEAAVAEGGDGGGWEDGAGASSGGAAASGGGGGWESSAAEPIASSGGW